MAGQAGYKTKVKIGGTAVPVVDEPCTMASANNYYITDATRNLFDRYTTVVVEIDNVVVDPTLLSINYLFGKIVTQAGVPDGVMTVSYSYIPTVDAACTNSTSLDITGDVLDDTCFKSAQANNGFRTKILGINDISGSLENLSLVDKTFRDAKLNRNSVLVEWDFDGTGTEMARGWFVVESDNQANDLGGLIQNSISLQLNADDSNLLTRSFSFN